MNKPPLEVFVVGERREGGGRRGRGEEGGDFLGDFRGEGGGRGGRGGGEGRDVVVEDETGKGFRGHAGKGRVENSKINIFFEGKISFFVCFEFLFKGWEGKESRC